MARLSPAQASLLRKQAAQESANADPYGGPRVGLSAYETALSQLYEHKRTLKTIQSIQRKIDAKRAMLADFEPYLDGVLEAGNGQADEVLTTCLIWHIDAGNYGRAVQLAAYAVQHGMELPDHYERTLPTALADEFGEAGIKGQAPLENLFEIADLVEDADIPDQARAKLLKALGWAHIGKTNAADVDWKTAPAKIPAARVQSALAFLRQALELHEAIGVKKDIERLERLEREQAEKTR